MEQKHVQCFNSKINIIDTSYRVSNSKFLKIRTALCDITKSIVHITMGIWIHKMDEYCVIMLRKDNVQDKC